MGVTTTAAAKTNDVSQPQEILEIDLRDPRMAAVLAWLIPGAGHLYQRRTAKAILFFVCIMGVYSYGMYLGEGHVVYASMRTEDRRLPYFCQVGVGLPALPALVQSYRMSDRRFPQNLPKAPLWSGFMAPPRLPGQIVPAGSIPREDAQSINAPEPLARNFVRNLSDELHVWNLRLHGYFELGTVYTMIAGLLNVLVIYDAWGGPMMIVADDKKKPKDPREENAKD